MTTSDGREMIRRFIDRLEAFLLTHDDHHPVLAGTFGSKETGGCPLAQITGVYEACQCTWVLADLGFPWAPQILSDALRIFVNTYDMQMGAHEADGALKAVAHRLGKARPAIRTAIEEVKAEFGLDEIAPIEEPVSKTLVAV